MKLIQKLKLLIINYHYIRNEIPKSGIYPIQPGKFKEQLDLIREGGYKFISLNQIHDSIISKSTKNLPKNSCLLTFDDGLRESYEIGFKILKKQDIPAVFYIVSDVFKNHKVLDVHKLHYVRSKIKTKKLLEKLQTTFTKTVFEVNEAFVKAQYPWDDFLDGKLKYIMHFQIPEHQKSEVIDQWFKELNPTSEEQFSKKLYLDRNQLKEIFERNYLGTHSRKHLALTTLTDAELIEDITGSIKDIESITQGKIKAISYPYGESTAISEKIASMCKNLGLISGVTMLRGVNNAEDLIKNPLMLKRFDTNDVYGGKSANNYDLTQS